MDRTPVESKMFRSIGFSPEIETLQLEFTNGTIYTYSGFKPEDWKAFNEAESKGRHFGLHIRGKFPSAKVEPKAESDTPANATRSPQTSAEGS